MISAFKDSIKKLRSIEIIFFLAKMVFLRILVTGCARRGVSGALFPKSASCGAESPLKGLNLEAYRPI